VRHRAGGTTGPGQARGAPHREGAGGAGLGLVDELIGVSVIWLSALAGTVAVCSAGAACVPCAALALCAYCFCCRRRAPPHRYTSLPADEEGDPEAAWEACADRAMERACCVREMREAQGASCGHRVR